MIMRTTETQRKILLNELKRAGSIGVNSFYATYTLKIKQAPTRIYELSRDHLIKSVKKGDKSVNWVLLDNNLRKDRPFHYEFKDNTAFKVFD